MSQSLERLLQDIFELSETERILLFRSLAETLTMQGSRPVEGIAVDGELGGDEVVLDAEQSMEKNSSSALDPNSTLPESTSSGSAQKSDPRTYESNSHISDKILETVHRYKILRLLAQGGLVRVYVARDMDLGRDVALKQIISTFADHPEFQNRFMLEAKALANLEHPGVVGLYGQGRDHQGRPFFLMKLASGEVFTSEIKQFHARYTSSWQPGERLLELRRLLSTFINICNIVAYAHSRGVLHRDIKPSNVICGKYGETFLVDWGLAKILFRHDPDGDKLEGPSAFHPDDFHGMTQTGAMVGTPSYMSPEQAAGRTDLLEPASDVYSLGATLYDVLIGRPPFLGASVAEIILNVRHGRFPKPREISPELPPALERVCLKAMALRPEDRYASPTALADDIRRWLAGTPISGHGGREGKSLWPLSSFVRGWLKRKQESPSA